MPRELLTIELVPRTCWYSNVRSEVSAEEWERLKRETFRRARYICEVCGGRGPKWPVECHERWEYDDDRRVQKLAGLVALCPACHQVKHIGKATADGHGDAAVAHLAEVNGWTLEGADRYVAACFELWRARSNFEWELDISFLDQSHAFDFAAAPSVAATTR